MEGDSPSRFLFLVFYFLFRFVSFSPMPVWGVVFGMRTVTGYRDGFPSLSFLSWVSNMKHECHSYVFFFPLSFSLVGLKPFVTNLFLFCQRGANVFLCFVLHMPKYANTIICLFFYLDYILCLNTLRFFKFFYDM